MSTKTKKTPQATTTSYAKTVNSYETVAMALLAMPQPTDEQEETTQRLCAELLLKAQALACHIDMCAGHLTDNSSAMLDEVVKALPKLNCA